MKNALTTIQMLIRLVWTVMLILGLLFWGGLDPSQNLIKIHMFVGVVLVLLLWGLAYLAVRARVEAGLVGVLIAWSVVLPTLGMTQSKILPNSPVHWGIYVLHLLVGIGALALAETLGGRVNSNLEASKVSKRPVRRVRVSK